MNDVARLLEIIDEEPTIASILPKPLPIPVQRFCSEIDKNFELTATSLDSTAARLEQAAAELRSRANDLRAASPDVRGHVERWITFERESNERGKFLNTLFEPPAKG